jgi:lipid A 3-O-deacylase
MKVWLFSLFVLSGSFLHAKPDLLSVGSGINDIIRKPRRCAMVRIEYKSHLEWATIRPMVGFFLTAKKATYLYGGFGFDWVIARHFLFSPNFAVGYYQKGEDKDLGFPLEFRSGAEVGWVFNNEMRLGAHFYHISNASLGHKNPGSESLVFFLAIPISLKVRR